jgi:zinc protease
VYLADKPGAVQSVLRVALPWGRRDEPDYPTAVVANRIVGADFLSRLNRNLREKNGFTYGCYSAFSFRRDRGLWMVQTDVRGDATAAALAEVVKEIDGMANQEPPSPAEVAVAKSSLSRSFPESFETDSSLAEELVELAEYNLADDYLKTYALGIDAADLSGVRTAGKRIGDPSRRIVLVVGDRKTVEPMLKKAGFKSIKVVDHEGRLAK